MWVPVISRVRAQRTVNRERMEHALERSRRIDAAVLLCTGCGEVYKLNGYGDWVPESSDWDPCCYKRKPLVTVVAD